MTQFGLRLAASLARAGWTGGRLALLVMLMILEPLVRLLLAGVALLLALSAVFYCLAGSPHHRPVAGMLGVALVLVALLAAFYALARAMRA